MADVAHAAAHSVPEPAPLQSDAPPEVSVVVPTFRRPVLLGHCLSALTAQTLAPRRYEIIVCDDGCDDATRAVATAFDLRLRACGGRVVYVPVAATQGPAGARNRGVERARASVVAFTDDDTIPDREWLASGMAALRRGVAAVAGSIRVPLPEHPTDYERDAAGLARAEFATANCFVRREVLARIGGFDERYGAAWREDSDLQFSILRAGGTIVRCESAFVLHPVRPARWGVSLSQQRKSQFDALLYKKHRHLYDARIAAAPPWSYYAIVACAVATAAAVLIDAPRLALVAIAGWIAMTGSFTLRRLRGTSKRPSHVAEMIVTSILIPPLSIFWRLYGALRFGVGFL